MSSSKSWAGRQGAAEVTAPTEQAEGVWHDQQQELSKNAGHGRSGWAGRARAAGEAVRAERAGRAYLKQQRGRTCRSWGVGKGRGKEGEARARSGRG